MMVSTMVLVGWRYLSVSDARHIFLGKYLLTEHTVLHSITLVTMTTKIVFVCRLSLSIAMATMDEIHPFSRYFGLARLQNCVYQSAVSAMLQSSMSFKGCDDTTLNTYN